MGTPEDPDESYGSNYTGALRFSKMKTDIRLYTLLWIWLPKERTEFDYYDKFYKTLVKPSFMLGFWISLKLLLKSRFILNKSRCVSDPNYLLTYK